MLSRRSSPLFLLLVVVLLLVACGGGDSKSEEKPTAPPAATATPAPRQEPTAKPKETATKEMTLEDLTPHELGLEIGALYLEAIQAVTELVKDRPPVAEVQAQVAELKETYVQRLVPLGRRREALGRQDLAAVNNAINATFIAGTKSDWYNTYFEAVQYYAGVDKEFQQLLYSFNLIGNYARFELLREQAPEEAVRLGLMEATVAETPASAPETAPGETVRNEPGGYSFQPIADFVLEESGGRVVMSADGGDPEYGPAVIIIGGPNEGHASVEALFDSLLAEADAPQLSNRRDISVDGVPAIAVDVKSQRNGNAEVSSRIVVALGNANQQLAMFGFAPTEQWNDLEPLFEGVLASIHLFEPATASAPAPATGLGEERRSEYGGFVFRPIQGYEVTEEAGMIGIFAPDGDVDTGPGILILSLFDEEVVGLEPLVDALTADAPDLQVSEQRQVTVGGVAGVAVDLSGSDDQGRAIASRVVVVLPEPTRQFTMIGIAPPERWNGELEPLFEAVLASISFFEPVANDRIPQPQSAPPGDRPWVEQSPGWTLYSNANYVQDVTVHDGILWAATKGGLTAWDPASGELIGKWTTQDGLVHNEAYAVTVCPLPEPRVVVGTRGGLSFYDPETDTWENWTSDTSELERDFVTGLACHPGSQTLLIGYSGMVVSFYHAGTGEWRSYDSFNDGLRGALASDFAIVGDLEEVWVAGGTAVSVITPDGVFAYDDDNSAIPDDIILSVAADEAGNVWLGAAKGLIQVNGDDSFTLYNKDNITNYPVGMSFIEGLDFASNGTLWASTSSAQVCHFDPATATCIGSYSREPGMAGSFNENLIVDEQGSVYYTSNSEGISFFDGSAWQQLYLQDERLAQNELSAIAQGHDGDIWIGTKTHSAQRFWAYDPDGDAWQGFGKEIPSLAINTLYADPRGGMWVGHGSGASFYDKNGHWTHLSTDQGLPGSVKALAVDASGRVWFGTGFDGLAIWDGEQFTYLTEESGDLPSDSINAILADGEVVWVSTNKGLLRFENDEHRLFDKDNSDLPRNDVYPLALDVDGTLLAGVGGFLMRLEDAGQTTEVTRINDYINSITVGPDGELWLGTYSAGAFHFDGQEWGQLTAADGLASPTFLGPTQILVDYMGTVWFANSFGGLAHYVP